MDILGVADVMITQAHIHILEEITSSELGLSFNKLAVRLRGKVSRVTLSHEIRKLVKWDLVEVFPDPHHRQRRIYRIRGEVKELVDDLRIPPISDVDRILASFEKSLRYYANKVKKVRNKALKDYMKHVIMSSLHESLVLLGGQEDG